MSNTNEELVWETEFQAFQETVEVLFTDTFSMPNETQKKNYEGFISKQNELAPQILNKVFEFYQAAYPQYKKGWLSGGMNEDELEDFLPNPTTPGALKEFIIPATVYIQSADECKEGTIGIEFDCTWDEEHGLGVLIENWKVVEAGPAAIAYL